MENQVIEKPVYDYKRHTRSTETILVEPKEVIIIEGILILNNPKLVELMDIKLFVDTDADLRIIRRLSRDIKERGRELDSIIDQYLANVRPMHLRYVEPTKHHADIRSEERRVGKEEEIREDERRQEEKGKYRKGMTT